MVRTIGIGIQSFEKLIENHCFYVDKTDFIKEWWESKDDVTLITRPRRFGKTLNMNMLKRFLSIEYKDQGNIFRGLSIWEDEEYRSLQGTYPVIALSFASIKATSFKEAQKSLYYLIEKLYNRFDFLVRSDCLNEKEKRFYDHISVDMDNYAAISSLNTLSEYLCRYYGKPVIILLDEYDTPLQEAWVYGYWRELVEFIRSLFNATFKTNPYLERALMTGITRVSKESIFSDLNNLEVVTSTSEKYENSFGFTEEEVWEALKEYGRYDERTKVKDWYDGFIFGRKRDIYNPWSVLNYLDKRRLSAYWVNTSSNSLVDHLVRRGSKNIKMDVENLLKGGTLETRIDEQIVFDQLEQDEMAIWSLFLASGYLKVESYVLDEELGEDLYRLALTNKEVYIMFKGLIRKWFSKSSAEYNGFMKAMLCNDIEAMNAYMNEVAMTTISFFDTGKKTSEEAEPERFYHGFVLGLIVDLSDRYIITSNRESGLGRYDVVIEPRKKEDDAIIMEFKVRDSKKETTLEDTAAEALLQIERKKYEADLEARGIASERIRKYGFAFEGKQVLIQSCQ
ncbi:MAG: AAA family ATPase [Lachnospiraceae bacterium]|nr:AAA family ATPase [Lachnospiraceae bacterium]